MNNNQSNNNNSNEKYMIIFTLVLFAGVIIFNAVNSPLIGGSNIIYVNNSAPSITVENVDDNVANTNKQEGSTSAPSQDEYSYQSSSDSTDHSASQDEPASQATSDKPSLASADSPSISANSDGKININTADAQQLMQVPGIGDVLADRIIQHRQINGVFKSVDELTNVDGIGEKTLDKIRDYITV